MQIRSDRNLIFSGKKLILLYLFPENCPVLKPPSENCTAAGLAGWKERTETWLLRHKTLFFFGFPLEIANDGITVYQ